MNIFTLLLTILVVGLFVGILAYIIRIVPQSNAYVVERLGAYHTTWNTGVHLLFPFVDRVANKTTLKEVVKDFAPQPVITKDNVTMQIDTVVYFQITDPKLYTYGVVGPITAIENLTATTLRNIIGDLELDETLTSRDIINTKMRAILDEATDPWGIKVNRVEVKNIIPPRDIQEAMEKQMRAERERRESILRAEGEKRSNILTAEGEKEAMVLRANAKKESMIAEAEGQAQAMERIYEAQARGIEMIKNANPTKEYLSLKSLETYEKMADGKATKIVVPSEIQNMASFLTSAREILVDDAAKDAMENVLGKK
ncbi:sPFH/Band 7/PHB domain protein [Amedibacillus dolichus CAG:375]|uniref:SPFH/Band 7/PHB domain protein n=1 Tax=Amedibacillus dolichus CAG:375 TaxID=1263076 RepID=R7G3G7_9FIRM|nr:SPFH domain-containing protein [Amedibacillus dolichus]CDE21705.1 sPFH/Band 7/PHB domain protein [Amedibacillus dolichus CAG:375]